VVLRPFKCITITHSVNQYLFPAFADNGFDVLNIKIADRHVLWPPTAQAAVSKVVDFLTSLQSRTQPILVHGFSFGCYFYGLTIVRMCADRALKASMAKRIEGQVFDSLADLIDAPHGVAMVKTNVTPARIVMVLTNAMPARIAVKATMSAYMTLFHNQVTLNYHKSSQAVHENPFRTPSLVFFSEADLICPPGSIEVLINGWKKRSVPVWTRCCQDSPHVQLYLRDPVNYTIELNNFLQNIGLAEGAKTDDVAELLKLRSKL